MLNIYKNVLLSIFFFSLATLASICANGQTKNTTRVLFIFDASQSMYSKWEQSTRMDIAKNLLSNMLDSLSTSNNVEMALRVYGHQRPVPPQDCSDTKLEVGFAKDNVKKIKTRLKQLQPKGTTPITESLRSGALDFPESDEKTRNIVVLITDGIEECGGDPCAVSRLYQEKKVILKPFVIGIGLDEDYKKSFECVGTFFNAQDPESFKNILNVVVSQVLNSTTAQVNLLDIEEQATETNIPISFYDAFSGILQYSFVHTMNSKGLPDTLTIDPILSYKVVAHTIPPTQAEGEWKLNPGKHTTIPIYSPQGKLALMTQGNNKIKCIVRQHNSMNTLFVQDFNTSQRYLVGKYDLEILTLPRIYETIEINQSTTTKVGIPAPGLLNISYKSSGYGSIFENDDELKWICDLSSAQGRQSISLQAGNYIIIYRPKYARNSLYTIKKEFKIYSKKSVSLKI